MYWMTFFTAGIVIITLMTLLWLLSLWLQDSSIVDIFWGFGFVVTGWLYYTLTPDDFLGRKILLMLLVFTWGMRLTLHIYLRNRGQGEDYRYAQWREEAGEAWWWQSFFRVFLLQGILMWLISAPLLAAQLPSQPPRFTFLDILGVLIWGMGFYFEAVGDWQLAQFKANPENEGKVLRSGVWRYTRHPNYFGDAAQWWGFFIMAAQTWTGLATISSPILMTVLLIRVSGVALLEKNLTASKPKYEDYIRTTSAFFPWFPRDK